MKHMQNKVLKIDILFNDQWLHGTKSFLTVYKTTQIWLQKEAMESLPLEAAEDGWRRERAHACPNPGASRRTGKLFRGSCGSGAYFL